MEATPTSSVRATIAVIARNWWVILLCAVIGAVLGMAASLAQQPVYRSTATLYVTSGADANSQSAYQGSLASQQRVASYAELVTSDAVVTKGLRDGGLDDLSPAAAKEALDAMSTPETVLLRISADSTDEQVATRLADAVAESLTEYVTGLERPSSGGAPLAKLTVVNRATPESGPVSPKILRNTVFALLAGVAVGLVIVFVRRKLDVKVRSQSDVTALSGAPAVLTTVPSESVLKDHYVIDFRSGSSPAAESYRRLRTNLGFVSVDRPLRTILVTSAGQGEGKTTTAMNVAAALAEAGQRVVVVDADLRKPTMAARFGVSDSIGVTDYLAGNAEIVDLLQETGFPNLAILASGALPPNPAELLGSERARTLMEDLSRRFDHVVVDSPPVLPVTDAAVLASLVDGVVVVVRAGRSRLPELADALERLRTAHAPLAGVVVNDERPSGSSYRYAYYRSSPPSASEDLALATPVAPTDVTAAHGSNSRGG
ncbi:polysaccharide biosynthesis tyrosine autokinase [Gordonia soli]|uniref:polysaccharide biosynthesis tyrosine autokinase n=1 Tax=Gordonia soli TaxID=320799 RepID=UPI001FDEE5AA|nr:polysaccharide biosynthesis tyrosine autokinase [Gordonia soli]